MFFCRQSYLQKNHRSSRALLCFFHKFLRINSVLQLKVLHLSFQFISKEKFVAAGAGLQFAFGLGAMSGPFLCSLFMKLIGSNGYFVFLIIFHSLIGAFAIYRMRIRETESNPDSQFVAMPSTITPAGIELNPITEPIDEPEKIK